MLAMTDEGEPAPPVEIVIERQLDHGSRAKVDAGATDLTDASDAAPVAGAANEETAAPAPTFHDVGVDRLGAALGTVADSVAQARDRKAEAAVLAMAGPGNRFADLLPDRTAQVVQATPLPTGDVITMLEAGGSVSPTLTGLTKRAGSASERVAVFDGLLQLSRPSTRRRVELRIYPTASGNLTVLELLPRRVWMPQTRRYLAAGVPAITELTDHLELVARQHAQGAQDTEPPTTPAAATRRSGHK